MFELKLNKYELFSGYPKAVKKDLIKTYCDCWITW